MAFVRNDLSKGDDVSTRPDTGNVGQWKVGSVGVGGTGMTQLKGLSTSETPGVPAFVAQRVVSVIVLPCGNTETEESRCLYRIPGRAMGLQVPVRCWCRLVLVIPMRLGGSGDICRIALKGVLWVYRRSLLLVLKMSRSTLSNANLTPSVYYTSSKSITLRLMPEDGWRMRVEQLSLGFQLHVREPEARTLEVVVRCGVAGVVRQLTNRRAEDGSMRASGERRDQM